MQKLFAMKGACSGAVRLTPSCGGCTFAARLCPAPDASSALAWAYSAGSSLSSARLTLAHTAEFQGVRAESVTAVFVSEGSRILSFGASGLTRGQLDAAALRVRLAITRDGGREKEALGAKEANEQTSPVGTILPAPASDASNGGSAVPKGGISPENVLTEHRKLNAVTPQSRAASAIVSRANSLFSPTDADYDASAFLAREAFRPRPAESAPIPPAGAMLPCVPPAKTRQAGRRGCPRRPTRR